MQIQLNFAVIRQRRLRLRLRLSSEQRVVGLSAVSPGLFALFAHTQTHCAAAAHRAYPSAWALPGLGYSCRCRWSFGNCPS